ncbi:homoserine dehydrogenase [Falsibacillus albus]|uniref:Homoserine dehydrogenase n=1 Tax=Falsibacillus albus TaxID=2478915 RepID=A0A3L7JTJ8_9BACI|nr:homoserine dehydrogenase [Falsibacillus albus]RLQ94046.1 homoserine dehydrogenase [Falsibacillus albus]
MSGKKVKVGLMGMGTVGTGVIRLVNGHKEDLHNQTGMEMDIARILVQNPSKERALSVHSELITDDPYQLLHDPEIDVIVEVMGGIEPTKSYILEALEHGKHVVTANKDLVALHGAELLKKAAEKECDLFYEASVAGGIPILRALVEGFSSDRITKMMGIVNGTTNYILTKMTEEGAAYEDVLKEAQELGYAEADPSSDVGGLDAARKMSILSTLGFHVGMNLEEVECKGISEVTKEDILFGKKLGYTMKLIGIAKQDDGLIEVSVQPAMVKQSHPLASVNGVFNAVYVYGEAVGETMFYGPGAGELPTATAVVSDLVTVVKNLKLGVNGRGMVAPYKEKKLKSEEQIWAKYFMRLIVDDKSGVLAQLTSKLAEYEVSLEQVIQQPYNSGEKAELIMVTHSSSKKSINGILAQLKELDFVDEIKSCYRVEGSD